MSSEMMVGVMWHLEAAILAPDDYHVIETIMYTSIKKKVYVIMNLTYRNIALY
jgi:hypothetical protein